jgi:Ca-activated chloride channel family protein
MRGARIENVKLAALDLVNSLQPQDRLALISFSDRAEVLMPSTEVRNKVTFRSAISRLVPGGGTEIYQGLLAGLQEVRRHCTDSYISHVILFTDGRTYGDELQALAEARRAGTQNIGISALGIGEDWNDVFLDDLACAGKGTSAYIRTPSQVQKILRERVDELSTIVARGLCLKLTLDSSVRLRSISRVAPYLEMLDISDGEPFLLGDLNGEPLMVLLELVVQQYQTGERHIVSLNLKGTGRLGKQPVHLHQSISAQFVGGQSEQEPVPARLLNALSHMSVFRLQERAWKALDSGNPVRATQLLEFASTQLLNMGHRELSRAALLEAGRVAQGGVPTLGGRKKLRYGTRSLAIVPIKKHSRGGL